MTYVKRPSNQYHLPNSLKNEVQSRWNVTLFMLNFIKKAQETSDLKGFLESKDKSDLLTNIDNDLLDEVVELFEPFLESTLHFEAKANPTIHYEALYRIELEEHLTVSREDWHT